MIKKYKTSKLLIILISLLISISNISYVRAASAGGTSQIVDNVKVTPTGTPTGPGELSCGEDGWTATCSASTSIGEKNYIDVDMWDMYGNYIAKTWDFEKNLSNLGLNNILSGTYIGLNLYEKKTYWKHTTISSTGIQEYQNCRKKIPKTCYDLNPITQKYDIERDCSYWTYKKKYKGTSCPEGYKAYTPPIYEIRETCESALATCKSRNKPSSVTLKPSYSVEYPNSNDIDSKSYDEVTGTLVSKTTNNHDGEWYWHIEETMVFSYNMMNTCINVKTGDVSYNRNCNEKEYEVKQGVSNDGTSYWKYFVPLESNSQDDIKIYLKEISGSGKISGGVCISIIENHPNEYINLIKAAQGQFVGNIKTDEETALKGCYWATTIRIPIEQKFYNELSNGKNLKGFNFYYKPIDVNNPFPNGLSTTSIWNDWNDSTIKTPDMSKSYSTITYIAQNINTNTIRTYTANNPYTSWENMYVNGRSGFIDNEGIVRRNVDNNSYYALGCGPRNTNLETSNAFYQSECDKS